MSFDRDEILRTFLADGADVLDTTETTLVELVGRAAERSSVAPLLRGVHTLKGNAMVLDLSDIAELAHELEEHIGRLRMDGSAIAAEAIQPPLEAIDALRRALPAVVTGTRSLPAPRGSREPPAEPRPDPIARR